MIKSIISSSGNAFQHDAFMHASKDSSLLRLTQTNCRYIQITTMSIQCLTALENINKLLLEHRGFNQLQYESDEEGGGGNKT